MVDKSILAKYRPAIGIECHVQLKTQTKLFSRVSNDAREAAPNTAVSPIDFGLPGVLPYLNQAAVDLAVKAGLALNAKINRFSKFDRKHYFYPDLPKGYQITQYDQPIVGQGRVEVPLGDKIVRVGIERAHLEEDAGKLTHPDGAEYSLVDLNRAGTPLLEIVSQPDIHSPAAAKAYARELYLLMKYADVSDVDLYHGHMRFDVNVSVAKAGAKDLGTRAEVKNLNSFRAVEKAAQFEFVRQVELLEKGQAIVQETRGWHDTKQQTFSQRSKEEAHDYRYFPEPDLPPVELAQVSIDKIKEQLPRLPSQIRATLESKGINPERIETLLDAPLALQLVEQFIDKDEKFLSLVVSYLLGVVQSYIKANSSYHEPEPAQVAELINLVLGEKVSSSGADAVFIELLSNGGEVSEIIKRLNLKQISDTSEMTKIVSQVITDNPQAAADVQNGEAKAIGFLVGQVMKSSNGQANPKIARDLINQQLGLK